MRFVWYFSSLLALTEPDRLLHPSTGGGCSSSRIEPERRELVMSYCCSNILLTWRRDEVRWSSEKTSPYLFCFPRKIFIDVWVQFVVWFGARTRSDSPISTEIRQKKDAETNSHTFFLPNLSFSLATKTCQWEAAVQRVKITSANNTEETAT